MPDILDPPAFMARQPLPGHQLLSMLASALDGPAYVYDLAEVRRNCQALQQALPSGSEIFYSLKANPHPVLLSELRSIGVKAEVCSGGELAAALHAGWLGLDLLYTGPGKRDRDVAQALCAGVVEFSVDSPAGLQQIDRLAAEQDTAARCLLRVNDDQPVPGQGLTMTGVSSQFGADVGWIRAQPDRFAGSARVPVTGLHLYMGTNLTTVADLLRQFERALRTARELADLLGQHGARIDTFDLGGGFGAPFAKEGCRIDFAQLRRPLSQLVEEILGSGNRICYESGRYLVGTAGALITRVLDVKPSQGTQVVVLESGINHLGGMSGLRRLPPLSPQLLTRSAESPDGSSPPGGPAEPTMVCGPLCTPLDVWVRAQPLGRVEIGDALLVPNVGAYGLSASLALFLGHELPAEMVIDSDLHGSAVVSSSRLSLHRSPTVTAP
jgi:diaminopimelate decarboxylase